MGKDLSKEALIESLVKISKELGRTPTQREIGNVYGYIKCFGSWSNAVKAAGLKEHKQGFEKKYTDEDLIEGIREKAKELGRTPTQIEMQSPSFTSYLYRFGTWNNALKAAGFDVNRETKHSYTIDELLNCLKKRYGELGRLPKQKELTHPAHAVYYSRFGGIKEAAALAGITKREEYWLNLDEFSEKTGVLQPALKGRIKRGMYKTAIKYKHRWYIHRSELELKPSFKAKPINPGERFGRLKIIENDGSIYGRGLTYKCQCDCGKIVDGVRGDFLRCGDVQSCGCLHDDIFKKETIKKGNAAVFACGTNIAKIRNIKPQANNTSGVVGVDWHKKTKKWQARITFKRKMYHLGYYDNIDDAAKARKSAEKEIYGDFLEWYEKEYMEDKNGID
ncbi:MAG: AP2 domain-containing protein [Lactococcus chungangensis]|nr:AP2 domain-containing protein [Lactococcus chungangensis]